MTASPTARTLAYCRKKGIMAGVVEKWIPMGPKVCPVCKKPSGGIRKDLFGFIDLIAVVHGGMQDIFPGHRMGVLGIQATSTPHMSDRFHKATEECSEALEAWLRAGNRFEIWGWAKRGAVGKRKLWTLKRWDVTLEPDGSFSQLELEA